MAVCHYERMTTTGTELRPWYQRANVLFAIALAAEIGGVVLDVAANVESPGFSGVGVLSFVFLWLLRDGRGWAWWAYVVMNAVGFAVLALAHVILLVFPTGRVDVSWPGLALSIVAFAAVVAPPLRPVNVLRARAETE
jgi:hypothetical protein